MALENPNVFIAVGSDNIGYSTDFGLTWSKSNTISLLSNNALDDNVLSYCEGVAYDGINTFVVVGNFFLNSLRQTKNIIGYSSDAGRTWLPSNTDNFPNYVDEACLSVAYDGIQSFVFVGFSGDTNNPTIGYSTDAGRSWIESKSDLFYNGKGLGIASDGEGTLVAVGERNNSGQIGYSRNAGITWVKSQQLNGLFAGGSGKGIAYDGIQTFVAVGSNDTESQIGYSTDVGKSWQVSQNLNGLFIDGCYGVAYGKGTFVAVGSNGSTGAIGYSTDAGRTWSKSTLMDGLFSDNNFELSTCNSVAYNGINTFVVVGYNTTTVGNKYTPQIGYSTDAGRTWYKSKTNSVFSSEINGVAYSILLPVGSTPRPRPTPTPPISNICFPAGTPIKTDQGIISIELINKEKHTIQNKPIKHVSQTKTLDKYLICFQPHSLGFNQPFEQTIMTKDHKICYKGEMVPAYRFLNMSKHVNKVQYNGELLYNILLDEHDLMEVNNLRCETLSPDNIIAQLYNNKYSPSKQDAIICSMNESLLKKDYPTYKQLIESTFRENKIEQNERFSMRKN
jgi:hypothetical protein